MKKYLLFTFFFAMILQACTGFQNSPNEMASQTNEVSEITPTVFHTIDPKVSQSIMEKWVDAYVNRDPDALLSLWSDQIVWSQCGDMDEFLSYYTAKSSKEGLYCDSYTLRSLKEYVPRDFKNPAFKIQILDYLVSDSGKNATVFAIYEDKSKDQPTPASTVAIIEFGDGKILNEWWHY